MLKINFCAKLLEFDTRWYAATVRETKVENSETVFYMISELKNERLKLFANQNNVYRSFKFKC